jgi:transposase
MPGFSERRAVDFTQWWAMAVIASSRGKWNAVFKRFSRWSKQGVWRSLHKSCSRHPNLQHLLIDSPITRAHACAAGAAESHAQAEGLGRSKGGYTTQIHAITDALGKPLDFILTGGQASGIGQAEALLQLTPAGAGALLGDKDYDSDAFVEAIRRQGRQPVIPRRHRIAPRDCNGCVYAPLIECFFNKIKHYWRVFSRF